MMSTISKDLEKMLYKELSGKLHEIAMKVQGYINHYMNAYYGEYYPSLYDRTDQLKNCCKIGKIKRDGVYLSIDVYLDIDSLDYESKTDGADPLKTVVSASVGLHGGWNVMDVKKGERPTQIEWEKINKYDSSQPNIIGHKGTSIWEKPMQEIIQSGLLEKWFKECGIEYGVGIRY